MEKKIVAKYLFRRPIRYLTKKSAYQILMGRLKARAKPEAGRFLRHDVNTILNQLWRNADDMIPEARLEKIPTIGNRQMVFFAVLTIAAYHALLKAGVEKNYAIELFADIGWKIYSGFITIPKLVAKIITHDPQKQVNIILRMFLIYPFSTPGYPGYECKVWSEPNRCSTYWTHCPPYEFVRQYVEVHGDHGELEAFQRSWCWYDWSLTYAIVDGGYKVGGHYERIHTLSAGDDVCDMNWFAQKSKEDNIKIEQATRP